MHIDRLRLVGFKSFADAAEVTIGPGLTGIIGPNGCGKSNLAEALRWVMGENSARRLRGGAMDDVIFGGSASRPARNLAEVALTIDNRARDAPFSFNDRENIEIVRRIERGGGSAWRVNGREVRARDVQLLFADAASGGSSGSIVSQGRVGAVVEARPVERRFLIEDAAGTAGIQARRHETELKLAAAEANLGRLDDVLATMTAQLAALKRQARHAQRYRRLGEQIREQEALVCHARWRAVEANAEARAVKLAAAEAAAAEAAERGGAAGLARDAAETALPQLRQTATEAAAELQRLSQARSALEQELARSLAGRREAERRLAELARDHEREGGLLAEAGAALARLAQECHALAGGEAESAAVSAAAEARLHEAARRLGEAETALENATQIAAAAQAQRAALERRGREVAERRSRLAARLCETQREHATLVGALVSPAATAAALSAVADADAAAEKTRSVVDAAHAELAARQQHEAAVLDAARRAAAALARLEAEAQALTALVAPAPGSVDGTMLLSAMDVAQGFEAAVGALFDDELSAPFEDGADAVCFWAPLPALDAPPLPAGAHDFVAAVSIPPPLARSLAFAGWVDNEEQGRSLQPHLAPGQRLVDRKGRLWRWDGFTRRAAGSSAAAQRLRHKNRLEILTGEVPKAQAEAGSAEAAAAAASTARQQASKAGRLADGQLREAEAALAQARAAATELAGRALATEARAAAAADALAKLTVELGEAQIETDENERQLVGLPQAGPAAAALAAARESTAEARRDEADARTAIARLRREEEIRRERLAAIDLEERAWRKRREGALAQQARLQQRRHSLEQEIDAFAARPAAIARESEALAAKLAAAAHDAGVAADRLAAGETRCREATENARDADRLWAEAREACARLDEQATAAEEGRAALARDIAERIGTTPAELQKLSGLADGEIPPDAASSAARLDRLRQDRAQIGPVNLIAEGEAAEIEARVEALQHERADLTEAIAKLRSGAQALDRQGRELLAAAFEHVNRHFGLLFTRLFGGGKAELALTDNGDPLTAGLEIMASPTGKRLQSLSLLSGGEQALTALALLFAVFLTKPAPICVLDEVDAPLDDANVDRLCSLVAEIADTTGTRFLLITHHRITMAQADRLFGVTMAEHGVSQLVSVDLARAARLRQSA